MSGFLLDTNVLSDSGRLTPNPGLKAWFTGIDEGLLFASVLSIGEMRRGVDRIVSAKRRAELEGGLTALCNRLGSRLIPIDQRIGQRWGRLLASLEKRGRKVPVVDSLIAATALEYGLTIVTRDERDFSPTEVSVINPFTKDI